jgi:soluble lytic murein transglycosylase-like protein
MNAKRMQTETRWKTGNDFRIICDCQVHARRDRTLLRRSLRAARQLKARSIALLVGVPLTLGALEFPTEAMNLSFSTNLWREQKAAIVAMPSPAPVAQASTVSSQFPIFTTEQVREEFLDPNVSSQGVTPEKVREHFFRTHVPYGSIIYREARRHNLQPELVAAIVEAESDFRPRLISHKNAQGLMQIIPSTGRLMGANDLFNPAENIAAGTKYLRYLFNRFGDQRMVLAAYNAGEGNVEKFGGIPPFPETTNYLRKVATRSNQYRQRVRGTYVTALRLQKSVSTQ